MIDVLCFERHPLRLSKMKISGADLHHLRVFNSVVRNGGISAAQMELSLSQPTISNHLTALEQRLGLKLCERGRRGFSLTKEGARVYEIGTEIFDVLDTNSVRLSSLRSLLAGKVNVGIVDCLATDPKCRISDAVAELAASAPEIDLNLRIMRPNDITQALSENKLDIGIGGSDIKVASLSYQVLYREEHGVFCGRSHPLFASTEAALATVDPYAYPWAHSEYWHTTRGMRFDNPTINRLTYDVEAQLLLVLSGSYLGILPVHYASVFEKDQRLRRLPVLEKQYFTDIELAVRQGEKTANVVFAADAFMKVHKLHL